MKIFLICKFFIGFCKKNAKILRKTLQVAKACNDISIIYAKFVMFFIKPVENDLKNFRSGNCFSFFYHLAKFLCFTKCKIYINFAKMFP